MNCYISNILYQGLFSFLISLSSKKISLQANHLPFYLKQYMLANVAFLYLLNLLEMICYAVLFSYIYQHDNQVASSILHPGTNVIKLSFFTTVVLAKKLEYMSPQRKLILC
jgi:hypothetical protein